MRKKIAILAVSLLPSIVLAVQGPYIKAEAGKASTETFLGDSVDGFAGRLSAGYLFGENKFNYGVETGVLAFPHLSGREYTWFFNTYYADKTVSGYNVDLLGVLKYTFDSNFLIFTKLGVAYTHQDITESDSVNMPTQTENRYTSNSIRPEVALGIGFQLSPHAEVDLTASAIATPNDPMGTLLLGFAYSF